MKKTVKFILIALTLVLSILFSYNYLTLNISVWNWTFFLAIIVAIAAQIFYLNEFKISKRLLFVLLSVLLTFISFLITFLVPAFIFPYSTELDINVLASLIGFLFIFLNITVFYTNLMIFINKLKEKEKPKSSFVKLIIFYSLIVTALETLIMILINKG